MVFTVMSPEEIARVYRQSDDKRSILQILGDLTCSSAEAVAALLGVDYAPRQTKKRPEVLV